MTELAVLRGTLEGLVATLALDNITPEDFDNLEAVITQMDAAVIRGDYEREDLDDLVDDLRQALAVL